MLLRTMEETLQQNFSSQLAQTAQLNKRCNCFEPTSNVCTYSKYPKKNRPNVWGHDCADQARKFMVPPSEALNFTILS